ncbi:MAG: extracellular solute-binding protein [Alphaproteobacteria bacterium]|nr:extracellular solute-binding protein [Alphaproteobacteria bacterium]
MKKCSFFSLLISSFILILSSNVVKADSPYHAEVARGVAMHGRPKYGWNFKNFDYVNPDAPKGGIIKFSAFGSYDTFNPFVIKGTAAAGVDLMYDTLTVDSEDEPFSVYGLIASTIEIPEDRSWVAFNLNTKAEFSDGTPITAYDVAYTFELLKTKGVPQYRYYYGSVKEVIVEHQRRVVFLFKKDASGKVQNRELPIIIGQMPVLPKHYWENKDFTATTLEIPVGSGAYTIKSFEPGRNIVYERNPNYWAKDIPSVKGTKNFDIIRYDYYRDATVAVEALKAGAFDFRLENEAKKWVSMYNEKTQGLVKRFFGHSYPSGMQGFVFNIRKPIFKDRNVREALALVFDFEWANKNLFSGMYKRINSYFDNSDLASRGLPSKEELELLTPFKDKIPEEVFTKEFKTEVSDGSGFIRPQLKKAFELLEKAGWTIQDGVLKNESGEPFNFEILIDSSMSGAWERISLSYVRNLKKLGISANLRVVDLTQYKNRLDNYDYDMITNIWGQSLSPGNEQNYYWGASSANVPGTQNYIGVNDEVVDKLIQEIIKARDRKDLVAATRALDRVLLWNYYVVPHWYLPGYNYVYWDKFGIPEDSGFSKSYIKGLQLMTWWYDKEKADAIGKVQAENQGKNKKKSVYERLFLVGKGLEN